jgi:hypothetical protein
MKDNNPYRAPAVLECTCCGAEISSEDCSDEFFLEFHGVCDRCLEAADISRKAAKENA